MKNMKRLIPIVIAMCLTFAVFWQFFVKGFIPMPASYMVAQFEPFKSETAVNGVPAVIHKAVGFDVFRQLFPFKDFMIREVKKGRLPLWNPYNGAGQPMMATLQPAFFNPFSYLLLFDRKLGWAWYIILQFPLLFLATYWYSKKITQSHFGAIISSLVLCFSGVVAARLTYGEYIYPLIALPVLLGLIEEYKIHHTSLVIWGFPFVVFFLLVSVQPQLSFYILLTVVLYAMMRMKEMKRILGIIGLLLLGVGIASIQLVPTLELYFQSNVTQNSSAFIFDKFLMPISHLVTILIPNFFGNSGTYNFWGTSDYTETVVSVGLLPLLFALIAVKKKKKIVESSIVNFFFLGTIITILLTLDWFFTRWLYGLSLPVFSTSIPTRLYILTTFFIAMLAGLGASSLGRERKSVLLIGFLGLLIVCTTLALGKVGAIHCPSQISQCVNVAVRNALFEFVVYSVGASIIFLLCMAVFRTYHRIFKICLIFVLIGVGVYNTWKILSFSPSQYVAMPHPVLKSVSSIAPARVAGIGEGSFTTNFATQYQYFDTNYYNPLYIKRYGELVSFVNTGDRNRGLSRSDISVISDASVSADLSFRRERFWDMTGSGLLITKKNDTEWNMIRRTSALPRVYLAYSLVVEPDENKLTSRMFSPDIDITTTTFVENYIQDVLSDSANNATGSALIDSYLANAVRIKVNTTKNSLLVLSDTFYPDWNANVDGVEATIYRTNYAFRGVVVPKGEHIVEFYYDPASLKIGLIISVISIFSVLGIGLGVRYGKIKF